MTPQPDLSREPDQPDRDSDGAAVLAALERDGSARVLVPHTEDPDARAEQLIRAVLLLQLVEEAWSGIRVSAPKGVEIGMPEADIVFKVSTSGGRQ